ncbi:nucleolar protein 11-like [Latimeria chalumnae]|uniref:nucleolar protein 11-like n=1 Tax=Latimeria chalumnae TaxID=7897 RepID=UPI0006D8FA69|nr:PREDICTED: nucleolar protein 11 [Latimeria chalumnae]|eukprot:XP_014342580.1 PREDICTED: nucleolar protein 11 [Latimeria chalumnae]
MLGVGSFGKMAAFCEEFTLCGTVQGAAGQPCALLGVEPAREADHVIVTDRGRTVTIYKVSDQKPLGSWTVKQGQTITCPAVYNSRTGEYVVVHNNKVLRLWKDEDVNLEKAFKATLSADVYRIHSLPDAEPLVLFSRGAVRQLDALLAAPQQGVENVISDGEEIRWSEGFLDSEKPIILFVTEECGKYFVYAQKLNPNILQKYKLAPSEDGSFPLSFTAALKNKMITLTCLYSNGCVYKILVSTQQSVTENELCLFRGLLLRLSTQDNTLETAAVKILDETHIAVLGAPPSPRKVTKDCLCIWNVKFQTVQAIKDLPGGTCRQMWCYGGKLYVPHGKTLTVIPYQCETSSLASALGKLRQTRTLESKPVSSFVNWDIFLHGDEQQELQQQIIINAPEPKRTTRGRKSQFDTITIDHLLADAKTASQSHLEEEFQHFLFDVQVPGCRLTIAHIAKELTSRCKLEPKFYPHGVLVHLVLTQTLSYSLCPNLLAVALEKSDYFLLQLCFQQFPDVPEAVTCACLKAFLNVSDASLENITVDLGSVGSYLDVAQTSSEVEEKMEVVQNGFSPALLEEDSCDVRLTPQKSAAVPNTVLTCPVGLKKAALLNEILLSAYSETFLLPHLKDLSAQQVVLFLQYLQYLYIKFSEAVNTELVGTRTPTINQIMDWVCLLLDAHFTVLVMVPEAKGLLAHLHKFVRSQVRLYSELSKIEWNLQELHKKKRQDKDVGLYSIEVIKFF